MLRRKGIGLYSHEQVKNTTPFQFFAQVVIGAIFAGLGAIVLCHQLAVREEEIRKYGSSDTNLWWWLIGFAFFLNGLVVAHAGVIFWTRRVVNKVRSAHKSRRLNKRVYPDDR